MIGLPTKLRRRRLAKALLMYRNKLIPILRFAFFVLLLFFKDTLVNGLEETAISTEAKNRARDATVRIYAKDYSWEDFTFRGSGFFVTSRVIVTNFHVIHDKEKSRVKSILAYRHSKKDRFHSVKSVRAVDRRHDLAILQVSASSIKPLHLGDSTKVESLDRVYIVGNPLGYDRTFSQGIISGEEEIEGVKYIQTDFSWKQRWPYD